MMLYQYTIKMICSTARCFNNWNNLLWFMVHPENGILYGLNSSFISNNQLSNLLVGWLQGCNCWSIDGNTYFYCYRPFIYLFCVVLCNIYFLISIMWKSVFIDLYFLTNSNMVVTTVLVVTRYTILWYANPDFKLSWSIIQ